MFYFLVNWLWDKYKYNLFNYQIYFYIYFTFLFGSLKLIVYICSMENKKDDRFKNTNYKQQDLYSQELFGIEYFNWLSSWEQFHIVQKYKLDESIRTK